MTNEERVKLIVKDIIYLSVPCHLCRLVFNTEEDDEDDLVQNCPSCFADTATCPNIYETVKYADEKYNLPKGRKL